MVRYKKKREVSLRQMIFTDDLHPVEKLHKGPKREYESH
jgi:hypothetical protein